MTVTSISIALVVALTACGAARADTLLLANGDRLSGTLLHLSAGTLTFKTGYAGELKIRRGDVTGIQTDQPVSVMFAGDDAPRAYRLATAPGGRIALADAAGAVNEARILPLAAIAYVNPKPEESGIGVTYKGRVTLSAAQVRGNTSSGRTYGEGEFTARAREYRYAIGLKGNYATDAGTQVASNWLANGNYDRFIDKRRFYYGRAALERDRFRDIDLRSSIGAGYGLQIHDTEVTRFSVRGGLDLVSIDRFVGARETYPALG